MEIVSIMKTIFGKNWSLEIVSIMNGIAVDSIVFPGPKRAAGKVDRNKANLR